MAEGTRERRDAFIVNYGHFNPVHRHHIEMMVQTRKKLQELGYNVVGGSMALINRDVIKRKKEVDPMVESHRLRSLALACAVAEGPKGWLRPEPRAIDYNSSLKLIQQLLEREMPNTVVFSVVGANSVAKLCLNGSKFGRPMVVVGRQGSSAVVKKALEGNEASQVFYVEELEGFVSSEMLREAIFRGDEPVIRSLTQPEVGEYFIANRMHLWHPMPQPARGLQDYPGGSLDVTFEPPQRSPVPPGPVEVGTGVATSSTAPVAEGGRGSKGKGKVKPAAEHKGCLVVGITGGSSAGKSVLARTMVVVLQASGRTSVVVEQSDHMIPKPTSADAWVKKGTNYCPNWEVPGNTDWDRFESRVKSAIGQYDVILVVGNCLLHNPKVTALLSRMIWIDVDEDTLWKRRCHYPRGWSREDYFNECIWPFFQAYRELACGKDKLEGKPPSGLGATGRSRDFGAARCLGLSGADSPDILVQQAWARIREWSAETGT